MKNFTVTFSASSWNLCNFSLFQFLLTVIHAGYGVYPSEQDCLDAPSQGDMEAGISSSSIDPNTYPQPHVASSQCLTMQPTTNEDACPHLWPNLHRWEDAQTWPDGQVPGAMSAVTLPRNATVLISGCSLPRQDPFYSITIPQGSEVRRGAQLGRLNLSHVEIFVLVRKTWCHLFWFKRHNMPSSLVAFCSSFFLMPPYICAWAASVLTAICALGAQTVVQPTPSPSPSQPWMGWTPLIWEFM